LVKIVQVRDGLDQREPVFAVLNIALEQWDETFTSAAGFSQVRMQAFKRAMMIADQLAQAHRQASERQFVSSKDQLIILRNGLKGFA
jgi:hypothetical protein